MGPGEMKECKIYSKKEEPGMTSNNLRTRNNPIQGRGTDKWTGFQGLKSGEG